MCITNTEYEKSRSPDNKGENNKDKERRGNHNIQMNESRRVSVPRFFTADTNERPLGGAFIEVSDGMPDTKTGVLTSA